MNLYNSAFFTLVAPINNINFPSRPALESDLNGSGLDGVVIGIGII